MRLIDADALVEQMEAGAEYCEDSICKLVYEMDIREVKRAPTFERKKGKWRVVSRQADSFTAYRCSECNELVYGRTNYCHNCGARMERGEANEDRR